MATSYLAFDLGASSGRAILGTLENGVMSMDELHRFETRVISNDGHLYWDVESIWNELAVGLKSALNETPNLRSLSVDSWAVDYVPLDGSGTAIRNPFCYRDTRTSPYIEKVHQKIERSEVYQTTGIQFLPFNTIYQIYTDVKSEPELVEQTSMRLLIADYFNFRFSGRPVVELSNASTTQLVDVKSHLWASFLLEKLGMDLKKFPTIVPSGTVHAGTPMSRSIPVVSGLSHDTACAVAAVPADESEPWIYLSSGTWSLIGAELAEPILSEEAFDESYTNELGLDGTVRFLKNMTGMWVLEECIRVWRERGERVDYEDLMEAAGSYGPSVGTVDLDEPQFSERGQMEEKLLTACDTADIERPANRAQLVRLILDSLAEGYSRKVDTLLRLTGLPRTSRLHIVGGGSRNTLLNQLTADACGMIVVAGPAESSALGNLLVQARSMGDVAEDSSVRTIARNSSELVEFTPRINSSIEHDD